MAKESTEMKASIVLTALFLLFSNFAPVSAYEILRRLPECRCIAGEDLIAIQAALPELERGGQSIQGMVAFVSYDEDTITVAFLEKDIAVQPDSQGNYVLGGGLLVVLKKQDLSVLRTYLEQ